MKQNDKKIINLFKAQYVIYNKAKVFFYFGFILSLSPFLLNLIVDYVFSHKEFLLNTVVILSLLIPLINEILKFIIRDKKEIAANIQEEIDLSIFNLNKEINIGKTTFLTRKIDNIEINENSLKYKGNEKRFYNWYSTFNNENIEISFRTILNAQRENISYNIIQRRKLNNMLIAIILLSIIIPFCFFFFKNKLLSEFINTLIVFLPFYMFMLNYYLENKNVLKLKKKTKEIIESVKDKDCITKEQLREIQTMIYLQRSNEIFVPNFLNNILHVHTQKLIDREIKEN